MRKSVSMLLMILFMIGIIIFSGCSSKDVRQRDRPPMNISVEERQEMFEAMQQKMIEVCQEKNQGDSCQFESQMGNMNGTCEIKDNTLVCISENPMRQRVR